MTCAASAQTVQKKASAGAAKGEAYVEKSLASQGLDGQVYGELGLSFLHYKIARAGISAKGFGDFFERLEPKAAAAPKQDQPKKKVSLGSRIFTSEILRTHPATADRLALVRAQPSYPATPALSDEDWQALRGMCG